MNLLRVSLVILVICCLAGCQPVDGSGFRKPAPAPASKAGPPLAATDHGEQLILTRFKDGRFRVVSRSMTSGAEREIYVAPGWALIDSAPSPDGRWLMILLWSNRRDQSDNGYNSRLFVYDRLSGRELEISGRDERIFAPFWIDNSRLAVLKEDSSTVEVAMPSLKRARENSVGGGRIDSERNLHPEWLLRGLAIHGHRQTIQENARRISDCEPHLGLLKIEREFNAAGGFRDRRTEFGPESSHSLLANTFDVLQFPQRWQVLNHHTGELVYMTDLEAKPSRDRRLLAYIAIPHSRSGEKAGQVDFEVGVWDPRSKRKSSGQVVAGGGLYDLHWAQDSRRFVYTRDPEFAQRSEKKELWLYNAVEGKHRFLGKGENGYIVPPASKVETVGAARHGRARRESASRQGS